MRLNKLASLHKRVIHTEWHSVNERDVELEDIWVKRYPYDVLEAVCSDCFSHPDKDIEL